MRNKKLHRQKKKKTRTKWNIVRNVRRKKREWNDVFFCIWIHLLQPFVIVYACSMHGTIINRFLLCRSLLFHTFPIVSISLFVARNIITRKKQRCFTMFRFFLLVTQTFRSIDSYAMSSTSLRLLSTFVSIHTWRAANISFSWIIIVAHWKQATTPATTTIETSKERRRNRRKMNARRNKYN